MIFSKKKYISAVIEFVNKWVGTEVVVHDADLVAKFSIKNIIIRFGCPKELISDTCMYF